MDENVKIAAALLMASAACLYMAAAIEETKEESSHRRRRRWTKESRKNRKRYGNTQNLLRDLKWGCDAKNFLRMDEVCFGKILSAVKDDIKKKDTILRESIPIEEKLAITLRYLATGETFTELDSISKMSKSFIAEAVIEVCDSIYRNMKAEYLKFPTEKEEWTEIADNFNKKWRFPLCVGALDGKHIAFTPAKEDAPLYYNYQGFHSMVLLAVADADARFIFVDVGCNGGISDGEVLQRSALMQVLLNPDKYLPRAKSIGSGRTLPHVFLADNAFPLMEHMMTPYPLTTQEESQQVFNRRLSRARQTVERAFGILTNRFQVLQKTIKLKQEKVIKIVLCCCVLHNFLIANSNSYAESTSVKFSDGQEENSKICNESHQQNEIFRKAWSDYFNNEENM